MCWGWWNEAATVLARAPVIDPDQLWLAVLAGHGGQPCPCIVTRDDHAADQTHSASVTLQTWTPAPPPIPVDTAPPKPPALPFSVSAQWRYENQSKIVVLRGNDRQYTLCNRCSVPGRIVPGKMLDSHYRLDKLTDTTVVLTYMPLKHVSTLRLDTH